MTWTCEFSGCAGRRLTGSAPFTVQRIAELVINPTLQHSSFGKFIRSLEKSLLVTSAWQAPSYDPAATSRIPISASLPADPDFAPGYSTPTFSPIPWLSPGAMNGGSTTTVPNGNYHDPISPLLLASAGRSPTPEPDSTSDIPSPSDPGHQSYLGRVDELDTGPAPNVNGHSNHVDRAANEVPQPGTGEGGVLTPHGMSERPVPISSTTTMATGPRQTAGLPRRDDRTLMERFVHASEDNGQEVETAPPVPESPS